MFVDHIKIYAWAGKGGHGCVSFRRAKYIPKGGPDGGDGAQGGDVILQVDPHTDNLRSFFYHPHLRAENGQPGSGQQKTGRSGKSVVAKVPPGTVVYRSSEGMRQEPDYDEDGLPIEKNRRDLPPPVLEQVADLTSIGERHLLVKGGKGGKGNTRFKSPTNRAPTESTPGEDGEQGVFYLELRRIADAGFVGFPNAGKSTLLGALSAAKPKVAAYPFTTLQPTVGVVEFEGFQRATLADIPGLIEGAHRNVGLGHDFLRHITRCHLLLFVVDIAGSEGRDPLEDLSKLRAEISHYDPEDLAKRAWLVIANKMDLPEADEHLVRLLARFPKLQVIPVSATTGKGLDELKALLKEKIGRIPV